MISSKYRPGFTAVELLITLFIAAAFLMSGYQLYSMIIRDGGEARARAKASNIAYEYLQIYKAKAKNPCPTATPIENVTQTTNDILSDITISATITCPYVETPSLSKISVTVKYNKPEQEVTNATYINL
ncbi:MAG: prepilin-type N-terminal cleavage/methylation domain-containing protein [Candidatus Saccharibacteria bacterium]